MKTITNVKIFDGVSFREESAVTFSDGVILSLNNRADGENLHGLLLCPGFVDIHMHGIKGLDSMRAGDIAKMSQTEVQYGVTAYCPTSITETAERTQSYLADIRAAMASNRGARILGAHLEGPFLAESVRGIHDINKLKDPKISTFRDLTRGNEDLVMRVTLAPERHGGMELVKYLSDRGVCVSIGHSVATSMETSMAIGLGVTSSTHTFNGMETLHHRKPGVLGVILTDPNICAEFIADLVHIDPIVIRLIYQSKGPSSCFFCTDSMEAAGMPDGEYFLGREHILVESGVAQKNGKLAGSTLTMDQGLRNLVFNVGIPLPHAIQMGTQTPADLIRRTDLGRIRPGAKADFVVLDQALNVIATFVRGICEYRAD